MKKQFLLSACLAAVIFILISFSIKKKAPANVSKTTANIIDCFAPAAAPALMNVAAFKAKYGTDVVRVRKNVDLLTPEELNALKVGFIKMKGLPYTNPTSWMYQAAIHGTVLPDNLTSWNSCHRVNESFVFLAWHRMYLYFFERILRAKSGRANLTLPYWNYKYNPVLPPAYRNNNPGNPLYDATRNNTINNGGSLPGSVIVAFNNSMEIVPYYTFQGNLSSGPHGSVHTSVAGNMTIVSTAAQDPVFWLHHSNVDRLWEEWLGKCGGRTNPIDVAWQNRTFTFFDETGAAINMNCSQVVAVATQLNYKYDSLPVTTNCPATPLRMASRKTVLRKSAPVLIKGQSQTANFANEATTELDLFIKKNKNNSFDFAGKPSNNSLERLTIIFNGIKVGQMPQGVVEVYLNLPDGRDNPNYNSKYFVGLLDLFSAEHHSQHIAAAGGMNNTDKIELDATKVPKALKLTPTVLKSAEVLFFVRGNNLKGKEVKTQADITIQDIESAFDEFQE